MAQLQPGPRLPVGTHTEPRLGGSRVLARPLWPGDGPSLFPCTSPHTVAPLRSVPCQGEGAHGADPCSPSEGRGGQL